MVVAQPGCVRRHCRLEGSFLITSCVLKMPCTEQSWTSNCRLQKHCSLQVHEAGVRDDATKDWMKRLDLNPTAYVPLDCTQVPVRHTSVAKVLPDQDIDGTNHVA